MDLDPFSSKEDSTLLPKGSSAKKTFLFVNESTAKAGNKVGRRTDIKSHVRNHIVQRGKKNQARDGVATLSASPNDSHQSIPASLKGKEKETRSMGRSQTSQAGVPISEWHQSSSASFSGTKDSVPSAKMEEQSILPPNPEASWYHIHAPSDQSQMPSTTLPKPNIVSDVLERAISLTIGSSSVLRGFNEGYDIAFSRSGPQGYLPVRRNSGGISISREGDPRGTSSQLGECAICDDPNRYWMDCGQHGGVWERQGDIQEANDDGRFQQLANVASQRLALSSRPLDQLGSLGSGRVDPFTSYPLLVVDTTGTLNELFDHCKTLPLLFGFQSSILTFKAVTYLLPGLIADGSTKDSPSLLTTSWISAALKTPLLFHALVFSASIHLSFLRTSTIHPNSRISLTHKQAVIQQLNDVLDSPTERIRDEIILAILILSSHEVMDLNPAEEMCFDSPLKKMQWLNVYGNIRNVQEHLIAVMNLVNLRGGVENLELYGLAELLIG